MSISKMTGRERAFAAVTRETLPDQLPVNPVLQVRGIREGGLRVDEVIHDGEAVAMAKIKAHQKFGGDVVLAGLDILMPVENLGAKLEYLPYAQPSLVEHPAPTREAFYRLKDAYESRGFDPEKGRMRGVQNELQTYIKLGWKDTHVLGTNICGPVTTAQMVTGTDEFFTYLAEDPGLAHQIIELSLDCIMNICTMMVEAGVDVINIPDPFCSCDILPPDLFREFALPYQKRLFAHISATGGVPFSHICTYTEPIWEDIVESGAVCLNGDLYPSADVAKKAIGDRIALMGTLSPYSTLTHGTPEDVANEVKKLAAEVGVDGGFICMPGCDIDWTVPDENLHALIQTCASIRYPIDVEALGDLSKVYLPGQPGHPGRRAVSTEADPLVQMGIGRAPAAERSPEEQLLFDLASAILDSEGERAVALTRDGLEMGLTPQRLIFDGLSLGMRMAGDLYERNQRFITDMLKSAKAMEKAMPLLTPLIEKQSDAEGAEAPKTVVMGLVRGNAQDIGKNLVVLMLKANGYRVVDLGKNVRPKQFVQAAEQHDAIAVGMSVMTNSSVVYAEETAVALKEGGNGTKRLVMIGGAGVNEEIAKRIGAKYGVDANAAVGLVDGHLARAKSAAA